MIEAAPVTFVHVLLSLVRIGSRLVVLAGRTPGQKHRAGAGPSFRLV